MVININTQIYLWLSILKAMNYDILLKLLTVFKSEEEIYQISKNKVLFYKYLSQNSVYIPYILFKDITSDFLKQKSNQIFLKLTYKNIKIIPVNSKFYPKFLLNLSDIPLVIYINDISILNTLNLYKVCTYIGNSKFGYAKKIYDDISSVLISNNYLCINLNDKLKKVGNIKIKYIDILDSKSIETFGKNSLGLYKNFSNVSYKIKEKYKYEYINEILISISKFLVIFESGYSLENVKLLDIALNKGIDIVSFPGSIYDIKCRLNNWVISQGAMCITSKKEFEKYLTN